ncbi:MAG TPA: DNA primase [Azospirillaceae bacterium]|nr:DNA primase [Azospirillaceae bacterium]
MAFPPQFLEELRARLPLSEVVGRRMRLIRAGREFKAPCPFHNEKTPSFTVNDQKGFFHCFGCGAHGDVIGFVMRHDNLSFPETVEQLAGLANLPVPTQSPEERERFERQKTLYDVMEAAARWFEQQLYGPAGRAGLDYFHRRGLDDETMARFRLGFAPADSGALRAHLVKAGFPDPMLEEAGLIRRREGTGQPFAFFRNRVIFPVADRRGRVVAFGARLMEGDGPKYINSGDTPLFQKGQILYGMARARQAAAEGQPTLVVEGYMDVIACVRAGFTGAVAPLGTALTETQLQELWKLAPQGNKVPFLCFDGDNAGRRAAWRAVERVLPHLIPDHSVRVAFLPEGEDPDSLIRTRGAAAMRGVLDHALALSEMVWDMETRERNLSTPEAKAGLKAALEARCREIADRTVQEFYLKDMRRRVDEAFAWKRDSGGQPGRPWGGQRDGRRDFRRPPNAPDPMRQQILKASRQRSRSDSQLRERFLLATIINHPELFEEVGEALGQLHFIHPTLEELRQAVVESLSRDSGLDAPALCSHLSVHGFSSMLEDLLSADLYRLATFARPDAPLEKAREGWHDALTQQVHRRHVRAELEEAKTVLRSDATDENFARMDGLRREIVKIHSGGSDDSGDDPLS